MPSHLEMCGSNPKEPKWTAGCLKDKLKTEN